MGQRADTCSIDCLEYLKDSVLKHQITPGEVACVVFEPVLGEGGYVVPPEKFVKGLSDLCAKEGILFIADEVQSGFGRTGTWFGSEHFGVTPDIITMAKGIASGLPLSAIGATTEIMSRWTPGAHGTTFGGNPVSCAASIAVIETIEKESLLENVKFVGSFAMERLKAMGKNHPVIGDVRGLGLMIGIEFVKTDGTPDKAGLEGVIERCLAGGLIIVECGPEKNVARLMPPLNTTADEMDRALDIFEEALAGL
jgi:4-aminobutyrate aminotransferase